MTTGLDGIAVFSKRIQFGDGRKIFERQKPLTTVLVGTSFYVVVQRALKTSQRGIFEFLVKLCSFKDTLTISEFDQIRSNDDLSNFGS